VSDDVVAGPRSSATSSMPRSAAGSRRASQLLVLLGPGVMVMLADTDAGSVVTAGQSGARYGYQLV
jgi:Mn2+/Fe2+ NRAMP family transporter